MLIQAIYIYKRQLIFDLFLYLEFSTTCSVQSSAAFIFILNLTKSVHMSGTRYGGHNQNTSNKDL